MFQKSEDLFLEVGRKYSDYIIRANASNKKILAIDDDKERYGHFAGLLFRRNLEVCFSIQCCPEEIERRLPFADGIMLDYDLDDHCIKHKGLKGEFFISRLIELKKPVIVTSMNYNGGRKLYTQLGDAGIDVTLIRASEYNPELAWLGWFYSRNVI